jgi:YD repeat-containing protein
MRIFLKHIFLAIAISFTAILTGCPAPQNHEGDAQDPIVTENKKRPEAPLMLEKTTYKIFPTDEEGSILNKEMFDDQGQKIKFESYDYYGSGDLESETTYEYDAAGKLAKMFDGTTTETYTYDAQGKELSRSWSRANGQGAKEENIYDDLGNLQETKYYDSAGKYDFSRIYSRKYDPKGQIIEESKLEKYTDGTEDLEMYRNTMEYDDNGRKIKEIRYRDDGMVMDSEVFVYDGAGNLLETQEISAEGHMQGKEVNEYNEYGEVVKDYMYNVSDVEESLQYTNVYRYDEYGNMIYMMYQHAVDEGDAWGERVEIRYAR